jgi:hypothetical protein
MRGTVASLRLTTVIALLLVAAAPALAQTPPLRAPNPFGEAPPAPTPDPLAAPEDVVPLDPNGARRQSLFDVAFASLVAGDLILAERAFAEAAALPGNAVMSAVADSFVERVQQLRERRQAARDAGRPAARPRSSALGRTERVAILATSTALGLGLWGWAAPYSVGIDPGGSTRGFVAVYMFTAAGSFIVPYMLLGNEPVTPGQANLAFYGGTRGMFHGLLLGSAFGGELSGNRRVRTWAATMLMGSVLEMAGGYHFARAKSLTAGQARTMAAMGDLGILLGFGTAFLLRLDGGPIECPDPSFSDPACFAPTKSRDDQARALSASGLTGAALGLGAGYLLARHRDHTWGDGEVVRATTAIGAWTGAGVAELFGTEISFRDRPFAGLLMGGALVGALAGDRLVGKTRFTPGQSMLIDLSALSGGLLGAGTTYLLPGNDGSKPYFLASAAGAVVGFGLSYWGFHRSPDGPSSAAVSRLAAGVTLVPTIGLRGEQGLALAGSF